MNFREFRLASAREDANANDVSHYFSHRFALGIAYSFYRMGASPNFVTWCFLLLGVFSAVGLWAGYSLVAYFCWRLHIITDMADGAVARGTKNFSHAAMGFDRSNHIVINTAVLIASIQSFQNDLVALALITSFYLFYFFSRNYETGKGVTREFSLAKNIIKDVVGFEGYILCTIIFQIFGLTEFQIFAAVLFSGFFLSMYLMKLKLFLN
jgi:phosphatidylglycerophosphate synthase